MNSPGLGVSWEHRGQLGGEGDNDCDEPNVLPLGNGSVLAACRFQNDPCAPVYYSSTAVAVSHNQGRDWSKLGLLTGWAQPWAVLSFPDAPGYIFKK
jgi:hypothetical protein